jgi:hypothetical protein
MGTTLLESPVVETEISNGEVLIYNSGDPMTKAKADSLAAQINAGTLPFTLVASGYDSQGSAGQ